MATEKETRPSGVEVTRVRLTIAGYVEGAEVQQTWGGEVFEVRR